MYNIKIHRYRLCKKKNKIKKSPSRSFFLHSKIKCLQKRIWLKLSFHKPASVFSFSLSHSLYFHSFMSTNHVSKTKHTTKHISILSPNPLSLSPSPLHPLTYILMPRWKEKNHLRGRGCRGPKFGIKGTSQINQPEPASQTN